METLEVAMGRHYVATHGARKPAVMRPHGEKQGVPSLCGEAVTNKAQKQRVERS